MFTLIAGFNQSVKESLYSAIELAKKATELDDLLPQAHASLAWSLMWKREIDEAIIEIERVVELNPNDANTHMWRSMILSSAGKGKDALEAIEKAMRVNPHYHVSYIFSKVTAFFALGQYEEANFYYDSGIVFNPDFIPNYLLKISLLSLIDRDDEILITRDKILKINPDFKSSLVFFNDERLYKLTKNSFIKASIVIDDSVENYKEILGLSTPAQRILLLGASGKSVNAWAIAIQLVWIWLHVKFFDKQSINCWHDEKRQYG